MGLAGGALLAPFAGSAASPEKIAEKSSAIVRQFEANKGFSGSVLVARMGSPVFRMSVGWAQREKSIANAQDTRFNIGSITKPFTATAILKLVESGQIELDQPISKILGPAPETWRGITIRHLLRHESGIPDYLGHRNASISDAWTPDALIEMIARSPVEFLPGSKFSYSSSGYVLLGCIIEAISNRSYGDFLRGAVLEPVGLHNTAYDDGNISVPGRADGYRDDRNVYYRFGRYYFSAGGLYSTVDDLLTWEQALSTGALLSASSTREMFTKSAFGYGLGWFLRGQYGREVQRHSGYVRGFSAQIEHFPADGLTVIVMANVQDVPAGRLADELAAVHLGVSTD